MPEALINGLALLGWNPPHREDSSVIGGSLSNFLKNEVMSLKEIEELVSELSNLK